MPDGAIYYLAIGLDLLLRFTWSLKLSPHLHSIHEIEQGVFLIETLEVIRRWVWVFLRLEWESVKRTGSTPYHLSDDEDVGVGLVILNPFEAESKVPADGVGEVVPPGA